MFTITVDDTKNFSELSGDFNPLHLDSILARRLIYGRTVTHGVHAVLAALDKLWARYAYQLDIDHIEVNFLKPIFQDEIVNIEVLSNESGILKFRLSTALGVAQRITLGYSQSFKGGTKPIDQGVFSPMPPLDHGINESAAQNVSLNLACNLDLLERLFPAVRKYFSHHQISAILATTRAIGMYLPGLNSIFLNIKLEFGHDYAHSAQTVNFVRRGFDQRFNLLDIGVESAGLTGELTAMIRLSPVKQIPYRLVEKKIAKADFQYQRAIIVGGSRGLGELAAKIIAAGGGDVLVTYNTGFRDCNNVRYEIEAGGGKCQIAHLDIRDEKPDHFWNILEVWEPTHLYYFATPKIPATNSVIWNDEVFKCLCKYYIEAFYSLLLEVSGKIKSKKLKVICPSTKYIDEPKKEFKEYIAAKVAAEEICKILTGVTGLDIRAVRLPPLYTDQTISYNNEERFEDALSTVRDMLCCGR